MYDTYIGVKYFLKQHSHFYAPVKKWRKIHTTTKVWKIEMSPILQKGRCVSKDLEFYLINDFTPYVFRDIPTSNAVQCYINDEACMKGGMNINKYVCHSIPYTVATSFTELFFSLTSWPSKNNTTVFSCPCCGVLFASFEFGDSFQTWGCCSLLGLICIKR